ncbi:hypothetical protein Daesc_003939 [Daldinia eschscholtzii]|uniref:Uncharacterized protein n=1 Tax=Daldinia eschscholtzii TaxID=292717 RepID=A0AAX6MNJ7_9PEZI
MDSNIPCDGLGVIDRELEGMKSHSPKITNRDPGDYVYTCPFLSFECTLEDCVIHGEHTEQEIAARMAYKNSGYDPANPSKLRSSKIQPSKEMTWGAPREFTSKIIVPTATASTVPLVHGMNGGNTEILVSATTSGSDCSKPQNTHEDSSYVSKHHHETEDVEVPVDGLWKPSKRYVLEGNKNKHVSMTPIPDDNDYVDPIFANEVKRHKAIIHHRAQLHPHRSSRMPLVFQYGVRYAPDPYPGSLPVSRTITITGFADDVPISNIMARVRGGQVISVTEAWSPEPVGRTVAVKFRESTAALRYVKHVRKNAASIFDDEIRVSLINAHTYPTNPELLRDISNGFTRLIVFLDFGECCPFNFLDDLQSMYTDPENLLEDLWVQRGALYVLFKSISRASKFYKDFVWEQEQAKRGSYDNESHRFAPDPCSKPLRDLQRPFRPARYPHQSLLQQWIEEKYQSTTPSVHNDSADDVQATTPTDTDDETKIMEYEVQDWAVKLDGPAPQATSLLDAPIVEITHEKFPTMADSQAEYDLIDVSTDEDKVERYIPKYMLPQNDPAYFDLLHRDSSDMVRVSEANAIFHSQASHTFSKEEIRTRYSGIF